MTKKSKIPKELNPYLSTNLIKNLPYGLKVRENQNLDKLNENSELVFIDPVYGEFTTRIYNIKHSIKKGKGSPHPKAKQQRYVDQCMSKWGVPNAFMEKSIQEKSKKTMMDKYGVEYSAQSPELYQKVMNTNIEKYGTPYVSQNKKVRKKQIDVIKNKYGVECILTLPEFQEKIRQTNLINLGSEYYFTSEEGKAKQKEQNIKKNGSKGEIELRKFIESLNLKCEKAYIGGNPAYELDILIRDKKIAFEYNGLYWHSSYKKDKNYHFNKTKASNKKGYRLIQIFENEWIEKKEQVKSFIKSTLGKNSVKINARECIIKNVSKQEAEQFLNTYHILGFAKFKHCFGLYYKNELISLMSFNKHHRNFDELILNRFIVKENVTVRGGLTKLCNYAKINLGTFYTFIDLRWSNGENWLNNGWSLVNTLRPDYFYYNKSTGKVVKKQSRKKSLVPPPPGITEKEFAHSQGLYQVWDCGKLKLKYS